MAKGRKHTKGIKIDETTKVSDIVALVVAEMDMEFIEITGRLTDLGILGEKIEYVYGDHAVYSEV